MESRFNKYKSEGKAMSDQIANINNYIDWSFDKGLDLIENEINSLNSLINRGENNAMFPKKIEQLISLGEKIEQLHETYHFNKDSKDN
jgi:hypothetical protein